MPAARVRLLLFVLVLLGNVGYIGWRMAERPAFETAPYVAFDADDGRVIIERFSKVDRSRELHVRCGATEYRARSIGGVPLYSERYDMGDPLPRGATVTYEYVERPIGGGAFGIGSGGSQEVVARFAGTFHTPPTSGPVTFALLGDSGKTRNGYPWRSPGEQAAIAAQILSEKPDFVLHAGDVVYPDGAWDEYAEGFFRPFRPLLDAGIPIYAAVGNHDLKTEAGEPFRAAFGYEPRAPLHRSFDWGDLHVAIYDSCSREPAENPEELAWLDRDLASSSKKWKVVLAHYPCYQAEVPTQVATVVEPILVKHKVAAYLAGHYHIYERCEPGDGVVYVTSGGGGKSLEKPVPSPHSVVCKARYEHVLVTLEGSVMRFRVIALEGDEIDRFEVSLPK